MPVIGQVVPLNAGDVESALAYWAENAEVILIGLPQVTQASYHGKEEVRGWLTELVVQHCQMQVKVIKVQGQTVTTRTEIWSDLLRQLNVAPLVATEVYLVNERKITHLTSTISSKSMLRLQAVLRKETVK